MIGPQSSFDPIASPSFTDPLVCVIESQRDMRDQLCQLFQAALFPVRAFASGRDFLDHRHHAGPCCLVAEVNLPSLHGLDLQMALAGRTEQVVFLSGVADVGLCARAMKAGAVDFLLKPADKDQLLEAAARALTLSQSNLSARNARSQARTRFEGLTSREFDVMHRIIAGRLNKQAAADLGIAEKTIKIHRGRVMHKLGVESVAELVRLAMVAQID